MLRTEGNRLFVAGGVGLPELRRLLATLHNLEGQGYKEIILDFGACTATFAAPMLGLSSQVLALQKENVSFRLLLPEDTKLARLFENTNWGHFLDPTNFHSSLYSGRDHVAAIRFSTSEEQRDAVNKLVDAILRTVTKIERPPSVENSS